MKNIYNKVMHDATMLNTMFAVCPITANTLGILVRIASLKSLLLKNRSTCSWFSSIQFFTSVVRSLVCVVWWSQCIRTSYSF